jgi:hypothetical protein
VAVAAGHWSTACCRRCESTGVAVRVWLAKTMPLQASLYTVQQLAIVAAPVQGPRYVVRSGTQRYVTRWRPSPRPVIMNQGPDRSTVHFRCTSMSQRVVGASMCGFFFFLESTSYFAKSGRQPGFVAFTTAFLVVIAWVGVRAARSATLLTNDDKVTVRGFVRTRSWLWNEIDAFVVETRSVGRYSYQRRVLGLRTRAGNIRWLSELNCRPAAGPGGSWVDDAAATLNQYL